MREPCSAVFGFKFKKSAFQGERTVHAPGNGNRALRQPKAFGPMTGLREMGHESFAGATAGTIGPAGDEGKVFPALGEIGKLVGIKKRFEVAGMPKGEEAQVGAAEQMLAGCSAPGGIAELGNVGWHRQDLVKNAAFPSAKVGGVFGKADRDRAVDRRGINHRGGGDVGAPCLEGRALLKAVVHPEINGGGILASACAGHGNELARPGRATCGDEAFHRVAREDIPFALDEPIRPLREFRGILNGNTFAKSFDRAHAVDAVSLGQLAALSPAENQAQVRGLRSLRFSQRGVESAGVFAATIAPHSPAHARLPTSHGPPSNGAYAGQRVSNYRIGDSPG